MTQAGVGGGRVRPAWRVAGIFTVLVGGAAAAACASGGKHESDQGTPPPIRVEVQNNLTVPTEITVYISDDVGNRRQLGFVEGNQVQSFTFQPTSYGQRYRLIAVRQLARPVSSPTFIIGSETTGTVVWQLFPNLVNFRGPEVVETTYVDTTKHNDTSKHNDTTKRSP